MKGKKGIIGWVVTTTALVLIIGGCSGATDSSEPSDEDRAPQTQRDDSFLSSDGGKADSIYNLEPGSAKADALLGFVNSADLATLDDDVSLDVRAAENIVDARADGKIATLKELDDIAWVGSRAFGKLYDYCQQNGIFESSDSEPSIYGIAKDSAEADAILELANSAARNKLDEEVGLDRRAVNNIVAYRKGDDGKPETYDDRTFETLEDLASINYVAKQAFAKMLEFVQSNGGSQHSVPKDSARAYGAFKIANTASESTLDDTVGLDARAADNIVDHRDTLSTMEIQSLKVLSGIHLVGDATIRKLADYAEAQDKLPEVFHDIPVGSRREHGILKVANEWSDNKLSQAVGLSSRAVSNIIDYREGHDGRSGTSDDQTFEDVKQLDGVSYVASRAFEKLLAEARDEGYVPPPTWRDLLPKGRIEAVLSIKELSCREDDDDTNLSEMKPSGPTTNTPEFIDKNGRYRMFGDNPGDLSIRFRSDIDDGAIPPQEAMRISSRGTFGNGYHHSTDTTWEEIEHDGRIDRTGRLIVGIRAELADSDFNDNDTICKASLELP